VTQAVYSAYRVRIGVSPPDEFLMDASERDAIYRKQYWDAISVDDLPADTPVGSSSSKEFLFPMPVGRTSLYQQARSESPKAVLRRFILAVGFPAAVERLTASLEPFGFRNLDERE
jgi:hypothetical protein